MTNVAFIGLGHMGSRMARRLLAAGHTVTVWNRTPAKATPLVALGAAAAETPAEAASQAEVVVTMLADPAALQAVTDGPSGLAAGVGEAADTAAERAVDPPTLIEMSTVGPGSIARLAAALPRGAGLLDAPVFGSLAEAEAGTLTIFVGGPAPLAERWWPLLTALGTPVHVGPIGAGAAAKLVANASLFGVLGVLGEALALARGLGLTDEAAFDVLAATPLAAQAQRRRPAMLSGQYPPRFPLSLARKDATLILEAATEAGVQVRLARAVYTWLADAAASGRAEQDYTAVLAYIRGAL